MPLSFNISTKSTFLVWSAAVNCHHSVWNDLFQVIPNTGRGKGHFWLIIHFWLTQKHRQPVERLGLLRFLHALGETTPPLWTLKSCLKKSIGHFRQKIYLYKWEGGISCFLLTHYSRPKTLRACSDQHCGILLHIFNLQLSR